MTVRPTESAPWWARSFADTVAAEPERVHLDRAAMLLSAHGVESLRNAADVDAALQALDVLAAPIANAGFDVWRRHLFVDLGFSGNGSDYHDVRNSFLPYVLSQRVGIPISLSVLAMEIGRRAGVHLVGVGMPGHFLISHPGSARYLDAFNGGEVLDAGGCERRFQELFSGREFHLEFLAPVSTHAILVRMLANLKSNYARTRDLEGLTAVMRMRLSLPDTTVDEGRELVRLLDATGKWDEAAEALDQLLAWHPEAAEVLQDEQRRLSARMN